MKVARALNARLIFLEHRYSGISSPELELNRTENLQWLTVEQAMADTDRFISFVRSNVTSDNSPVFLVGSKYAGSLAVWYHQRYAGRVAGVLAVSAPLLAQINVPSYLESVGQQIRRIGGDDCYDRIETGLLHAERLFANGSFTQLEEEFRVCNASCPRCDVQLLNMYVSLQFGRLAQEGRWVSTFFG